MNLPQDMLAHNRQVIADSAIPALLSSAWLKTPRPSSDTGGKTM